MSPKSAESTVSCSLISWRRWHEQRRVGDSVRAQRRFSPADDDGSLREHRSCDLGRARGSAAVVADTLARLKPSRYDVNHGPAEAGHYRTHVLP
jgi:hypothetical protein